MTTNINLVPESLMTVYKVFKDIANMRKEIPKECSEEEIQKGFMEALCKEKERMYIAGIVAGEKPFVDMKMTVNLKRLWLDKQGVPTNVDATLNANITKKLIDKQVCAVYNKLYQEYEAKKKEINDSIVKVLENGNN